VVIKSLVDKDTDHQASITILQNKLKRYEMDEADKKTKEMTVVHKLKADPICAAIFAIACKYEVNGAVDTARLCSAVNGIDSKLGLSKNKLLGYLLDMKDDGVFANVDGNMVIFENCLGYLKKLGGWFQPLR